jgi:putative PIN family toxin of toxin-antitoxin system
MQRIVVDTNVIVSALIQRSYPYLVITEFFFERKVELCVSDELMTEYFEVLARPKFSRFQDFYIRGESLLADIEAKAAKYTPQVKFDLLSDKDDNKILELAEECNADFIITGNTSDFTFPVFKTTKIVTPKEYWENYRPG